MGDNSTFARTCEYNTIARVTAISLWGVFFFLFSIEGRDVPGSQIHMLSDSCHYQHGMAWLRRHRRHSLNIEFGVGFGFSGLASPKKGQMG